MQAHEYHDNAVIRLTASSACNQVVDQRDQRDDEENVNQSARNMKTKTKKPQYHQDYEYAPKHVHVPLRVILFMGCYYHDQRLLIMENINIKNRHILTVSLASRTGLAVARLGAAHAKKPNEPASHACGSFGFL